MFTIATANVYWKLISHQDKYEHRNLEREKMIPLLARDILKA